MFLFCFCFVVCFWIQEKQNHHQVSFCFSWFVYVSNLFKKFLFFLWIKHQNGNDNRRRIKNETIWKWPDDDTLSTATNSKKYDLNFRSSSSSPLAFALNSFWRNFQNKEQERVIEDFLKKWKLSNSLTIIYSTKLFCILDNNKCIQW